MDKRGQSALEYLMTYGWALVVIVVVVAALFAFGLFSTPFKCSPMSGSLLLKDYAGTPTQVQLALQDGTGDGITNITVSTPLCTTNATSPALGATDENTFTVTGCALTGNINETVTVAYTSGSGLAKTELTTCSGSVS